MAKKRGSKGTKKKNSAFGKLLSIIFIIISIVLLFYLYSLNVMPNKYLYYTIGTFVIINFIVFLLMKFSKKFIFKAIVIVGCIGMGYGIYSLNNTQDVLKSMNIDYKTSNYVLVVNKDSSYKKISNLSGKKIAYLAENKDVLSKIKIDYTKKEYTDHVEAVNDLFDNKVDCVLLEQSFIDLLSDEESPIKDFKYKIRTIDAFSIDEKIEEVTTDVDTTKNSFIVYVSGIDTYGSVASVSRTDANMLVIVNPTSKQILLLSIPRDYYVTLHGKGKDKLTHSGIYGINNSVQTIEDLLNVDINYYYKINFTSLIKIVDAVNGLDVYSEYTFTSKDGYHFTKGLNHVNGKQALSFVRERKAFAAGDLVRNKNQQALMEAMFRKGTSKSVITRYNSLLKSVKGSFVTNMSSDRITSLIKMQLDDNAKWNITSYALSGTNGREYTHSYKANKLYVMIPSQETITKAKELIKDVYDGKKLESSYNNEGKVNTVTTEKKSNTSNSNSKSNVTSNQVEVKDSNSNSNQTSNVVNKKIYTVTYIVNDTTTIKKYEEGSKIEELEIPVKEGYEILGWYSGSNKFDFNTEIDRDITLTGKYKELTSNDNKDKEKEETN